MDKNRLDNTAMTLGAIIIEQKIVFDAKNRFNIILD